MINYVEVKRDNYILRGLHTKVENPKGLVVMFHGFTGHMNENGYFFKQLAVDMASIGYESLRFDFMGSGMSDGTFKEMTFLTEVKDARSIIDYALSIKKDLPLIVLGFSCGGAVSAIMSREYLDKISKLILCAPAGNMDKIARSYLINNHIWYDKENVDMGGYLMNINFIKSFDEIDLYEGVQNFKNPVLINHGTCDKSVPIEYGEKYAKLYPNCTFKPIDGSEHCFTRLPFRLEVTKNILEFLQK